MPTEHRSDLTAPSDDTPWWQFLLFVGAWLIVFETVLPPIVSWIDDSHRGLPNNAYIALFFAGFSCALFVRGLWRLRVLDQGNEPQTFHAIPLSWVQWLQRSPSVEAVVRWILGLGAVVLGYIIGTKWFT